MERRTDFQSDTLVVEIGPHKFREGMRRDIIVTAICKDNGLPSRIYEALLGLRITTLFDAEQLGWSIPSGSRAALHGDVMNALCDAGKQEVACELLAVLQKKYPDLEPYLVFFEYGEYRFAE